MLLGDLISRFDDEAVAAEAIVALGDLALVARVAAAATEQELTLGEFATMSVQSFAAHASDEDWLTMVGRLAKADDPGQSFLSHVMSAALAGRAPEERRRAHTFSREQTAASMSK